MADTLLLDTVTWDLVLDIEGNIAVAKTPYAPAQDTASAIRLFAGELWYDTTKGLPYFTQILGKTPPIALVKQAFINAARGVPSVISAKCFISEFKGRKLVGQVQIKTTSGPVIAIPIQQV